MPYGYHTEVNFSLDIYTWQEVDGVHFYYIRRGNLYFLATTSGDLSTIAVTEFLSRYCTLDVHCDNTI